MALLAAELAVGIARGLAGLVVAVLDVLLGVVLGDPGQDVLGVAGDGVAEVDVGRQCGGDDLYSGVEQELGGGVIQLAQHPAELTPRGQAVGDREAVGGRGVGRQRKAQNPDQRRVFTQVTAQVAHRAQPFGEFDQIGRNVRRARCGGGAGPGILGGALREVLPVEWPEQRQVSAGDRTRANERRECGAWLRQLGQMGPGERDSAGCRRGGCARPAQGADGLGQAVASRAK